MSLMSTSEKKKNMKNTKVSELYCGYDVSAHIFLDLSAHQRVTCSVSCLAVFPCPTPREAWYSVD